MDKPILVTGSRGLIGRHLIPRLRLRGFQIREFDKTIDARRDLRDQQAVIAALEGVRGVIHLAGISRVVWGQRDPEGCTLVNTEATAAMLRACLDASPAPWFVYASSREVYGQSTILPVGEDFPLAPMNVYATSKYNCETHCAEAAAQGLVANIIRFSSVYGCAQDHPDRVAPAFARAAAFGGQIRLEGGGNTLDFTFIDDVAEGLERAVLATDQARRLPPIHLVSGVGTQLETLAELARTHCQAPIEIIDCEPRNYDVSRFIGNPERAEQLLGWRASTMIESGFRQLVQRLVAGNMPEVSRASAGRA